jgi:hypothetical protein
LDGCGSYGQNYFDCIDEGRPAPGKTVNDPDYKAHMVPFKFEHFFGHLYLTPHYACAKIVDNMPPGLGALCRDTTLGDAEVKEKAEALWQKHDETLSALLDELQKGLPKSTDIRDYFLKQGKKFLGNFYTMVENGLRLDGSVMPFGVLNAEGRLKRILEEKGFRIQFSPGTPETGMLQQAHYIGV